MSWWIPIDDDTSWQDLTIAQEIAEAYNKRVKSFWPAEQTAMGLEEIYPDEDMTVSAFVLAVQTGIELMATRFSDPSATLAGQTELPANWASVAAMMTSAGLTKSGYWRRIAEGGTQPSAWTTYNAEGWSYGKITDKDLAGPWLFKDLETAISKLKRRIGNYIRPYREALASGDWGNHTPVASDVVPTGNVSFSSNRVDEFLSDVAISSTKCKLVEDYEFVDSVSCCLALHLVTMENGRPVPGSINDYDLVVRMRREDGANPFTVITGLTADNYDLTFLGTIEGHSATWETFTAWMWAKPSSVGTPAWSSVSGCQPDPLDGTMITDKLRYRDCCSVTSFGFNDGWGHLL